MTVAELISKLNRMPQDAEVIFFNKDTSIVAKGGYRITNIGIDEADFETGKEGKFSSEFVFMHSDYYDMLDGDFVWHLGDDRYPKFPDGSHVQKIVETDIDINNKRYDPYTDSFIDMNETAEVQYSDKTSISE